MSDSEIKTHILKHVAAQGGPYRSWYVGITADVDRRLFGEHNVPRKNHWWIHRQAISVASSRRVEKQLLDLGFDGGGGGGDADSVFVYAYLKAAVTRP